QTIGIQDAATGMGASIVGYAVEHAGREIPQMHVTFNAIRFRFAALHKACQSHASFSHDGGDFQQERLEFRTV
ncbi:hypothetical protein, partial [Mesorhizobium sp. M1A.F.Ca.IN.022.07.1.1]|uniref:hypothetical protein n=1 Tax=Mesorhizobium sp. M1A.F.Ca.IN.022.07.1.1 TaxID=2496767 RepID=UPI001FE1DB04